MIVIHGLLAIKPSPAGKICALASHKEAPRPKQGSETSFKSDLKQLPAVQRYRTLGLQFAARGNGAQARGPGSQARGRKHQVYQSARAP